MTGSEPAAALPAAPLTRVDALLGLAGGAMILGALLLLLFGGPGDAGRAAAVTAPALEIVEPAPGAVVPARLALVFRADTELELGPMGWGADSLHLHVSIDGVEFMPGGRDIEALGGGSYRWALGPLDAGEHALRLFWSDAAHRPILASGTPPLQVRVE